jgi:CDP-glucose 4,6-dehydratase
MSGLKNKKIQITGNTGFEVSRLSTWCLMKEAHVFGLSSDIPTKPSMYESLDLESKLTQYWVDILGGQKANETVKAIRPDVIFYLAAQPIVSKSCANPIENIDNNIIGPLGVLAN